MRYETVAIKAEGAVGTILLNRPDQFNTFSTQLAEELNAALLEMEGNDDIRVVIVGGGGNAFSTGIDLAEFGEKTPLEYHEWISRMDRMHATIASMRKPVIAMVHGYAVANGAGLLAAADFAIVAHGTKIGTTAINVGLLCTGPIVPMSYTIGKKKILEMLLSGDMIDADEAYRIGLVNKLVSPDRLEEETLAFAGKLASKSPVAVSLGKSFYYQMLDLPFAQRMVLSGEVFARLCTTEDAREGVAAFREKRRPEWKGR